jgi:soluble lytic murein transglycosylase-like protein
LTAGTAFAGEYAVLASGSRLHVDHHEIDGTRIRLYYGTGYVEMAAADVRSFEAEEPAAAELPVVPAQAPAVVGEPVRVPSPRELADAAADKYDLPRQLVRSVMDAESGFQPQAVSPKGAIGLMQLMPQTARELGVDPYDPAQNVEAGVRYLRDLLDRYDWRLWHALAAYNAGPAAVDKYGFVPPYRETINYVIRIDKAFKAATPEPAPQKIR